MIVTVTTGLDTPQTMSRFVEHNLASGVDHIDADEVLDADLQALGQMSPDVVAVRLAVLESVASHDAAAWGTLFKPIPTDQQLTLFHTLGLIREAKVPALIHGHRRGKAGIRPGRGVKLGV